jgi:hypothetical protein
MKLLKLLIQTQDALKTDIVIRVITKYVCIPRGWSVGAII